MVFVIGVAGYKVRITSIYDLIYEKCRDYLTENSSPNDIDIDIVVNKDDIMNEYAILRKLELKGKPDDVVYCTERRTEISAVHRKLTNALLDRNVILMHGALVSTRGKGYLITAPSGTGKSTRAKLWEDVIPDSTIVNGDKPLIKVCDAGIVAYGTPWSGKERWGQNVGVELNAVLLLERSEGRNAVKEIKTAEALPTLLIQTYLPDSLEERRKVIALLGQMSKTVRYYRFRSAPTPEAIQLAYDIVRYHDSGLHDGM